MSLDAIDRRILAALQEDGRITNQDLAQRAGLSPSACSRRLRMLEDQGIIAGYGARVDAGALGYATTVVVRISLERQTEEVFERFEAAVRGQPQIMECFLMSGMADYQLRVVARDAADYEALHKNVLSRLPGVARIESNFALRLVVRRQGLPIKP